MRSPGGEDIYLPLILDLGTVWCVGSASRPGRTLPPVATEHEAEWALQLVSTQRLEEKSFASARDRTSKVQFVVERYTD
jgi:hypothetical protein